MSERWPAQFKSYSIALKELFPIYVACEIWAERFIGKKLLFHCDNKAVVDIWSKHTAKCPQIANLLCELFFTAAKHNFTVNASHIPGTSNVLADALFHSQGRRFFQLAPRSQSTANKDFPSSLEYLKRELELLHNFSQYQRVQERHTYKVPPAKTSRSTASGVGQQRQQQQRTFLTGC